MKITTSKPYKDFLDNLKLRIKTGRVKAALSANTELTSMYWDLGKIISGQVKKEGWGAKVLEHISADLKKTYPGMQGLSSRNLQYMRQFYETYPDLIVKQVEEDTIVQRSVAQIEEGYIQGPYILIPWGHNIELMSKLDDNKKRNWYAYQIVENNWTRPVLVHQIDSGLYERQADVQKTNNFKQALPVHQSELADQIVKDPYFFPFLDLAKDARERELESQLIDNISNFLLELGSGFAYMGKQYNIVVDGHDFFLDLLFYHAKLKCYVVVELKTGEFKPEFTGKLNFYLTAVDKQLKDERDNPTIGLLLCRTKSKIIAEYSIKDMGKPIGISEYIPGKELPSTRELEKRLKNEKTA